MSVPLVSVVMPVYNTARYVGRAIESILNQTFPDFELLLLDDGSTDRSLDILKRYAAQDSRIRLISRENRGISPTRNELLALAQGEFVAVMDSDDISLPDRLAQQVAYLQQHPDVVWLGGAFALIDGAGRILTQMELPEHDSQIRALLREGHTSFLHPTALLRRSAVLQVGGYDEQLPLAEDLDLWLKLSQIGKLANLKSVVVQYRIHGHSTCDRYQSEPSSLVQAILDRAWQAGLMAERKPVTMTCNWRPTADRASRHQFMLKYGWWAFNSQQRQTATLYGIRAIAVNPFSVESWKLFACAALKPLPEGTLS